LAWLRCNKLEIRAYPSANIHAKLYIMTFRDDDRDVGRVITGSSNFTYAGLADNLEFNVELKNPSDYQFAKDQFSKLWADAVDVSDKYIETVQSKTWLNDTITPYQLYLKFLYEYYKDEIARPEEVFFKYLPAEFKRLEYQEQAVLNAKKILDGYGGVFISDVVGLGKTYMAAMLASQLDGRTLVLAPPMLLDEENPGSWPNVFRDFRVYAKFESLGKLDTIIRQGTEHYDNIIVDEAHRFRTETNITYEKLAQVCRGKRVILVTATPFNNSPKDILSQVKLFQNSRKSTIPGTADLEKLFAKLEGKLKGLDRQRDLDKFIQVTKENAREIRDKVLKYLMVRRTRREIETYFPDDLKKQGLRFPDVVDPEPTYYELDENEDRVFSETIKLLAQNFKYTRYTPLLYYKGDIQQPEQLAQRNLGRFMKILLVKRLESSFFAFRNTINRFIASYELFIEQYDKGSVYISKEFASTIFDLLNSGDEDSVLALIEEGKAEKFAAKDFRKEFRQDLESDLALLQQIRSLWQTVTRDPKLLKFVDMLRSSTVLKESKLIVFTESKETADYLAEHLTDCLGDEVLNYTGATSATVREKVIQNFDAKARHPKDDFRILVATEVLSEGVNLHRANVVINYDIPWNPTRLMQRVGRINRVDTKFDKIYTFNFFPTKQSNDQIKLKEAAEAKIQAFITLLGADARLLTDGEAIEHHELFDRLVSKQTITGENGEEDSGLKYLQVIRDIRDKDADLFEQIKRLPKKARTARREASAGNQLVTYFRKGKLQKFYLTGEGEPQELDFIAAAGALETPPSTKRDTLGPDFYDLLDRNKKAFQFATTEDTPERTLKPGRDTATQLLKTLKAIKDYRQFTDEQEEYVRKVRIQLEEGGLPRQTAKTVLKELSAVIQKGVNPLRMLAVLQKNIPAALLESHRAESSAKVAGPREVILSEYLRGE
jgi:superfamily II DNA or RNA helicase